MAYAFAKSLTAEMNKYDANFTVEEALLVNAIVDFSAFCTSIVAVNGNDVTHVRNLDFDFPKAMQTLMYT